MARRRWIADEWSEGTAALTGTEALHLARVLRAEPGMRFDVVADKRVWSAVVVSVREDRVEFRLDEELPVDAPLPVTLLLAIWKFDRMEWAIEKLTELGVERIVPVVARRTEKHLAQASTARVERWRRIALEAAKQSRRADVPVLDDPRPLKEALAEPWYERKILLAENERAAMLRDALESCEAATLAIGPEGGWAPDEERLFAESGWQPVSLGPRILRAETAAIVAAGVAAALLG